MKIYAAELNLVRLPLRHQFQTSSHRKAFLDHILVKLYDESGRIGWGEIASASDPFYGPETVESCWLVAQRYLLPAVLGTRWDHPAEVAAGWHKVRGNFFAKAGIDMAVWALYAETKKISLASALGGTRTEVAAGVSLGIEPTIDDLLAQVEHHLRSGYRRVKLKIAPGWDVKPVRAVRETFGDVDLHVDANGVYTEEPEHILALRSLDSFGLTMIEQPFAPDDLLAHKRLQHGIATPICLDESVNTPAELRTALALDAGRIVNIKVSRMGGLTAALKAHEIAAKEGIPFWCGGMHEFGIGRAANVALSALPGFTLPSDVSGSDKYYARDVIVPGVQAIDGLVRVPTSAGLGFEVDEQFISQNSLRSIRIEDER